MDIQTCMVICFISVVTGERSFWVDTVDSAAYTSETPTSWWDAANHECAKSDGHLFVLHGKADVDPVISLIDEQKVYWVGGFQYSYLKWTEDDTRYHKRVGYMYPADVVTPVTLQDNSASRCDRECGNKHRLYGLKGTSCYCLGNNVWRDGIVDGHTGTEAGCNGDYSQYCGDDTVMSVYRKGTYSIYYKRVGYMYPADVAIPVTLQDNSAFSCDLRCGHGHRLYGLKGTSCYCLGYYERDYITGRGMPEIRCPGDYDEWCGDDSVMTVYKKDAIFTHLSSNGKCGYVTRYRTYNGEIYLDENCDKKRQYICAGCSGYGCIRTTPRTWLEAYRNCTLAKPTGSNIRYIPRQHQYWIGLENSVVRKWIDGIPFKSNSHGYYADRRCYGVHRNGSSLFAGWYDCRSLLPALCNTVKRESTPLIGESTSTVQPSTQVIRASTQVIRASTQVIRASTQVIRASTQVIRASTHRSSTVTIFPALTGEPTVSTPTDFSPTDSTPTFGERTTSHHVKGFVNKGTDKGEDHPTGFPVIYIVGAGGVLAVGIVITLVLVFLKRQRRYCFKLEVEREDGVHYDRVVENLSYSPAGPLTQSAASEEAHPSPARTEKNAPMSTKKSNIPNENPVSNTGVKQDESVYNVPDETSPAKPSRTGHLSVRKDTAADPSDKEACFEDEGQYNVLHGKVFARGSNSGMYAHFGQGEGDVEYDTTRHVQNTVRLNDTYNHIGPSKEPIADDDDQYNVLRRERSQSAADGSTGIYDHITTSADQLSKVPAVQGPSKQVVDDIYSHVDGASKRPKQDKLDTVMEVKEYKLDDTKNIGKAGVDCGSAGVSSGNNTDHVYGNTREIIGPCNRPRCVEDEADYYNIDSVRKSKLASTSKEDEEVGNNVYSLAHEFSDK